MRNYLQDLYWLMRSRLFDALALTHRLLYEYSNRRFAIADRYLRHAYKKESLWKQYRRFFDSSEHPPYGETPLRTMRQIVERFAIEPHQRIMDLGCGSGRVALWLATQVGCYVVGIEQVAHFVQQAKKAQAIAGIKAHELTLIEGSLNEAPFDQVDIVYLYGLGLSDAFYDTLVLKIAKASSPPWVITIGGPLSEYCPRFSTLGQTPVVFPWGWTVAYLNVYVP